MKYIFVDFEMNPVSKENRENDAIPSYLRNEIIEIGAVMLNEKYETEEQFQMYIKPEYNDVISEEIQKLTGITTEMVADSCNFEEGIRAFEEWVNRNEEYSVYAWSENDLIQVIDETDAKEIEISDCLISNWLDFQEEFGDMIGLNRRVSLSKAVDIAGSVFTGRQHDALYDAINTAEIFRRAKCDEQFQSRAENIRNAMAPSAPLTTSIGDLFGAQLMKLCSIA